MADRKDAKGSDPREHPRDYDTPTTPEGTPPVIRPGDDDEDEDDRQERREAEGTDGDARESLERRQRERTDREGAGEDELDSMKPETLFPPD